MAEHNVRKRNTAGGAKADGKDSNNVRTSLPSIHVGGLLARHSFALGE